MKRLPMRKTREALRLNAAGLTNSQIAVSLGVGRTTAGDYLERAERAGFSWLLPDDLDDAALEQRLFAKGLRESAPATGLGVYPSSMT